MDRKKTVMERIRGQRFVMQILIIAAAVVLDQLTKSWIMSAMQKDETRSIIDGVLSLTYIYNTGASFGILQGARVFFLIATALTLIVLSVYMVKTRKTQGIWLRVCLSLIVAGALGNFIDRVLLGYVRDFIDFSALQLPFGLHFRYIFNVADSCLVVGSIMLGIYILFIHKEKDGKTLLARRAKKKDELLEGDEKLEDEDNDTDNSGERKKDSGKVENTGDKAI